jgi:hypothetical protein
MAYVNLPKRHLEILRHFRGKRRVMRARENDELVLPAHFSCFLETPSTSEGLLGRREIDILSQFRPVV